MADNKAIVIGAGIAGLATARALAVKGWEVTVIEKSHQASGASVRNFGMVWPIGQPDGELYEIAMSSRQIWKSVCEEAGIWYSQSGSLHLACKEDEESVLAELQECYTKRGYRLLSAAEAVKATPALHADQIRNALFSPDELIVDPREAVRIIPSWLTDKFNVKFIWGKAVTAISHPQVIAGNETFSADLIIICSGADFETLFPDIYAEQPLTRCKLQMMRVAAQKERIGIPLCGGLSLLHYQSFKVAPSLPVLQKRMEKEYSAFLKNGIHVMVSENRTGELTVGDSHEYGMHHDPFDRTEINRLILDYLKTFVRLDNDTITETWHGIYPRLTNGRPYLFLEPAKGVVVINGLGGAGMTLSFGLCEKMIVKMISSPAHL